MAGGRSGSPAAGALDLGTLLRATDLAGRQLDRALQRSRAVLAEADRVNRSARATRLRSRAHLRYAAVAGELDGREVWAVVRRDGTVDGDPSLLRRAAMVQAMGDAFDGGRLSAGTTGPPLAVALTLLRACDRVHHVDLGTPAPRPAGPIR